MKIGYWFNLFGSILLVVLAGLFTRSWIAHRKMNVGPSCCIENRQAHAYLCGEKIMLHDATMVNLMRVPGVSYALAHALRDWVRLHPYARVDEIAHRRGIGPKTLVHMRDYFY